MRAPTRRERARQKKIEKASETVPSALIFTPSTLPMPIHLCSTNSKPREPDSQKQRLLIRNQNKAKTGTEENYWEKNVAKCRASSSGLRSKQKNQQSASRTSQSSSIPKCRDPKSQRVAINKEPNAENDKSWNKKEELNWAENNERGKSISIEAKEYPKSRLLIKICFEKFVHKERKGAWWEEEETKSAPLHSRKNVIRS